MQGYDENLEVVRLRISGASETLQGYNYFWIRAVEGFDPKEHCAKCIRGGWKLLKQNRMKLNQPVELRMKRVGYICGETSSRNLHPGQKPHTLPMPGGAITYTKNLHLPFEKAPGHVEEVTALTNAATIFGTAGTRSPHGHEKRSSPEPPGDAAWDESVARVRADRERLKQLVADLTLDLAQPVPTGEAHQTYLRAVLLVADHTAYHLGQLVAVRRALGAWT